MKPSGEPAPGRNDPCPCGSGRKYKHCCLPDGGAGHAAEPAASLATEIRQGVQGGSFDAPEELQAFVDDLTREWNHRPLDDFHGLSPHQMARVLRAPLDSPDIARVARVLDAEPDAPLARLFGLLAQALGDGGLKPTAKGNLPRNPCRDIIRDWLGEAGYAEYTAIGGINREHDAPELHVTRVTAEIAGLIRKHRGRLILSRPARRMLAESGLRELYPVLFRTYATTFNWAYRDAYGDVPTVQDGWLFSVYLLHLYGSAERPAEFYADAFLQAFPAIERELPESDWRTPREYWRQLYTTRCLERFAAFLGLAELQYGKQTGPLAKPRFVRAGPMLRALVAFPGIEPARGNPEPGSNDT